MAAGSAYEQVKQLILGGSLPAGSPLIERTIAEQLGFSRIPIREALKQLLCEGLIITKDGRGLFTRNYNEQDILDLFIFRESLDGLATRLFTTRAESMQIEYIAMIFREMSEIKSHYDRHAWEQHDAEFHQIIARGTRNERVIRAVRSIYEECFYLNNTFLYGRTIPSIDPAHLAEVLEEHRVILEAIAARDAGAAEAAARSSVRAAMSRLMSSFAGRTRPGASGNN